jgi:repressor LexA
LNEAICLETLRAVANLSAKLGYPPSLREIGAELGIATVSGVHYRVDGVKTRGWVTQPHGQPRSLVITPAGQKALRKVPA